MALGVQGTGPYSELRRLRREVADFKYELGLIAEGMRRFHSKKKYLELIAEHRARIKQILAEQKRQKK